MNPIFTREEVQEHINDNYEINNFSYNISKTNSLVNRAFRGLKNNGVIEDMNYTEYTISYTRNSSDYIARSKYAIFDNICYLSQIWLDESVRGYGYGNKLVRQTIDNIKEHNVDSIYTIPKSDASKHIFSNFGFQYDQNTEYYVKTI